MHVVRQVCTRMTSYRTVFMLLGSPGCRNDPSNEGITMPFPLLKPSLVLLSKVGGRCEPCKVYYAPTRIIDASSRRAFLAVRVKKVRG